MITGDALFDIDDVLSESAGRIAIVRDEAKKESILG
jgi:hypothetical protein